MLIGSLSILARNLRQNSLNASFAQVFTNEENILFHENLHEAIEKKSDFELFKNLDKTGEFVSSLRKGNAVVKHVENELCFVCDKCKKTFLTVSELTKHVAEHPQVPAISLLKISRVVK